MSIESMIKDRTLPQGVMFNAYPDSIEQNLSDIVRMFERPEFEGTFSLFYILPTFFNSDLDRGFSIVDYNLNQALVSEKDLEEIDKLNIMLKFDFVLNHLSVGSPQFRDMLERGDASQYKDFFIDWNEFWNSEGEMGSDGYLIPKEEHLQKLFMRKPGLPILKVLFPDGSYRPYWNTFYQEVSYREILAEDLKWINGISEQQAELLASIINTAIKTNTDITEIELGEFSHVREDIIATMEKNRRYLGQMDLNAKSEKVWEFYDQTLKKLRDYGAKLVRLDAFAYLHKQPGKTNFFNKPGTWGYLKRLKQIAEKYELILLPEIHSRYGDGLHEEVAAEGFPIYDFFFPGLVIDALDRGTSKHLLHWIDELMGKEIRTINMLGCHDGIPVLDLKGGDLAGASREGLLSDEQIDAVVERILERGGRVKDLYGPDGKKISYYQVNATFFSALGEDERKMRLARAIQMFMPGIPQVWYLDLFVGRNNYAAADAGGTGGHKEINRTTLLNSDIEEGLRQSVVLDQLQIIKLRNNSSAFSGELVAHETDDHLLQLTWTSGDCRAALRVDLRDCSFSITHRNDAGITEELSYS